MIMLGPRLETVAEYVPKGAKLGDIGTDHAYLPISLYEQGLINRAIGVDIHKGPYQSALAAIREKNLENMIDIRLGNGLEPIRPGEVDVLTIAGMGGKTMLDILEAGGEVLLPVHTLILQPQGAEAKVRLRLLELDWKMQDERLVLEDERIYNIMVFKRREGGDLSHFLQEEQLWREKIKAALPESIDGEEETHYTLDQQIKNLFWQLGPLNLTHPGDLLRCQLTEYNHHLARQTEQMRKTTRPEVAAQIEKIEDEIKIGKTILKLLW